MNNKKPTLLILAAGIGSRYGGLKQLDKFSKNGDTILDFSIFDAIRSGFGKIIFVIRKNISKEFRDAFEKKIKGKIDFDYVFQEVDKIPKKYHTNKRIKPWGTGHAVLMAKDIIKENFAVINADDFYGYESFDLMVKDLKSIDGNSFNFNMIGYTLKNTISDYGSVSRGICKVDYNDFLLSIIERTKIQKINNKIVFLDEENKSTELNENSITSMNFFGFTKKFFDFSENVFIEFLEKNYLKENSEFYIPTIINEFLNSKKMNMKVIKTRSNWFGVTYKEDKNHVINEIKKLKKLGIYPDILW